jgi:hypothetical protein
MASEQALVPCTFTPYKESKDLRSLKWHTYYIYHEQDTDTKNDMECVIADCWVPVLITKITVFGHAQFLPAHCSTQIVLPNRIVRNCTQEPLG